MEWVTVSGVAAAMITVASWVRLKVERRRCVGVEEGWKVSRRGRQVWVVISVALVRLTGDRCGRLVENEAA